MSEPVAKSPVVLSSTRIWRGIAILILGTLLIGTIMVLQPFLTALAWAAVFSFTVWPLYVRLRRGFGGRSTLSALVFCLLVAAVVIVPLIVAVVNIADDTANLAGVVREKAQTGFAPAPEWVSRTPVVGPRVSDWWDQLRSELLSASHASHATTQAADVRQLGGSGATLRSAVGWIQAALIATSMVVGQGVAQLTLSLIFSFFFLKDGDGLSVRLSSIASHVSAQRGVEMLQIAGSTVRGVVYGILGTAVVQGVMAGAGLFVAGVPAASLLGVLAFVLSPVPLGPGLVCAGPAVWLLSRGHTGMGVFLMIWALFVSSIDNVLKPLLISRGSNMPFVLILIGVLGGAIAFGLIGVFIGPTLLAVAYKLMNAWSGSGTPEGNAVR